MLALTREQERVAFYLFGRDTDTPCPDCGAVRATSMSRSGVVRYVVRHRKGCALGQMVRKSLTGQKGAGR